MKQSIFVLLFLATAAPAADPAPWATYRGNPQRTGNTDGQPGPAAPALLWSVKSQDHFIASPVPVAADKLYVSGLGGFNRPVVSLFPLAKGPKVVFITEGAKGARAVTATQDIFVAAQKVAVVDTVGAGDTFNAGVLAALHQAGALTKSGVAGLTDDTLTAALSLGTRAAAVTVSRAGANPPWANEL